MSTNKSESCSNTSEKQLIGCRSVTYKMFLISCRVAVLLSEDPCEEKHSNLGLKSFLIRANALLVKELCNPVIACCLITCLVDLQKRKNLCYQVVLLFKRAT